MNAAQLQQETDTLADLEQRISRAVELVSSLRAENAALEERLATANALATTAAADARAARQELDDLRSERKQVKSRIEKLLGQLDLLTTA